MECKGSDSIQDGPGPTADAASSSSRDGCKRDDDGRKHDDDGGRKRNDDDDDDDESARGLLVAFREFMFGARLTAEVHQFCEEHAADVSLDGADGGEQSLGDTALHGEFVARFEGRVAAWLAARGASEAALAAAIRDLHDERAAAKVTNDGVCAQSVENVSRPARLCQRRSDSPLASSSGGVIIRGGGEGRARATEDIRDAAPRSGVGPRTALRKNHATFPAHVEDAADQEDEDDENEAALLLASTLAIFDFDSFMVLMRETKRGSAWDLASMFER